MKYNIIEQDDKIILKDMNNFDPKHIFECGQAFRWTLEEDGTYTTIFKGRVLNVKKEDKHLILSKTDLKDFNNIWYDYFDLNRDYGLIKKELSRDPVLKEATKFGNGLRILNQEPFETIISFIISANNQISRIKKSIELISKNYGEKIPFQIETRPEPDTNSNLDTNLDSTGENKGTRVFYGFPSPDQLAGARAEDLKAICRVGFRAERIIQTSKIIANGEIDIENIYKLDREKGKEILMTLPGVGPKVSDCILLFAYGKNQAFPVDVWVKRVMEYFYLKEEKNVKYIGKLGTKMFGSLAGFAQQYLFYYAREMGIGKK